MEIKSVKFIKSSPAYNLCPRESLPEYAFAGRSNVGKSSLLNMLVNTKNLARISSKPGKTRSINHYLINDRWYLVDLPGYGYAKTGKEERGSFIQIVDEYITKRSTLSCLFILIDSRHKPLKNDLEFINKAGSAGIPLALVFTKTDKTGMGSLQKNVVEYNKTLLLTWEALPPFFMTSSEKRTGREEILDFIDRANEAFLMPKENG